MEEKGKTDAADNVEDQEAVIGSPTGQSATDDQGTPNSIVVTRQVCVETLCLLGP